MGRRRIKPIERELGTLVMLERHLLMFVKDFSRSGERHEPLRRAIEHVAEQRTLLKMALAGDLDAMRARRMQDGNAHSMGE